MASLAGCRRVFGDEPGGRSQEGDGRAKISARPEAIHFYRRFRAGFEPCVRVATSRTLIVLRTIGASEMAHLTARLKSGAIQRCVELVRPRRAEIFALPPAAFYRRLTRKQCEVGQPMPEEQSYHQDHETSDAVT